jgi:DNA-binding Xre family transcriptional regulator
MNRKTRERTMQRTDANPNAGSSLEDFLAEEGLEERATATAVKRVIAWQLQEAMRERNLTKKEMASLMETSRTQLDRVLNPEDGNVTIETLQRAARVVGRSLRLELA